MKETRKYTRKCPQCGQKLVRNGTENSKQRWRCLPCGTARIRPRPDVADSNRRKTYTKHLTGKTTATEVAHSKGISRRTFDRNYTVRFHPTVGVEKPPSHTPWIVIDAKCLNQGIVAIVRTAAGRLSWRYAPYESSEVWLRLFTTYPTVLGIVRKVFRRLLVFAMVMPLSCSGATFTSSRTSRQSSPNIPPLPLVRISRHWLSG